MTAPSIGRTSLLVAAALLGSNLHPAPAPAQSAGLDQYRFPAGAPENAAPAVNGGNPAQTRIRAEDPGPGSGSGVTTRILGYPLTTPVIVVAALLGGGVALRLVSRRRRPPRRRRRPPRASRPESPAHL